MDEYKSTDENAAPPPVLCSARVLYYARVTADQFRDRTLLFVDGKELGAVPRLAICEDMQDRSIFLFHCNEEWDVLGAAAYKNVDEAKARAERIYRGVSNSWLVADIKPAIAEEYLREQHRQADEYYKELLASAKCAFCGRPSSGVGDLFVSEDEKSFICDGCVNRFYHIDEQL